MLHFCDMQCTPILGIAIHQTTLMFAGLKIFWDAYLKRKRQLGRDDCGPDGAKEVQNSVPSEHVSTMKIEIDKINRNISDFKAEIIEIIRKGMEEDDK